MVNRLPYPAAPSLVLRVTLTNLESCPGFLYLFGYLFAQCSSEPQVKQPSLFLSFFLPFLKVVFCWTGFFPLNLWEFFCLEDFGSSIQTGMVCLCTLKWHMDPD